MKRIFMLILWLTPGVLAAQNPVFIPDTLSGNEFNLLLGEHEMQMYPGTATQTMGVNGPILGPTLIFQQGDQVDIHVINQLVDSTTMHWHGMHVPPADDGGPHTVIPPNTTWNPVFTVMDKAGTYWYHPHLHTKTDKHVSKGIAGMIIVKDTEEAILELPRTYGIDDYPLVIQTRDFSDENQIVVHSNSDDVLMVNATLDPMLTLPAQVVRLRLLNGSSQRVFNLGFDNNEAFYQIASDGGLLSEPNEISRLRLAPGERAEILLNLTGMNGESLQLMSYASEFPNGIYGATNPGMMPMMTLTGYNPNPMNGNDFPVLLINVTEPTLNPVTNIPPELVDVISIPEPQAVITRNLTFTPEMMGPNALNGKFYINGVSFDMNTINYTIPLGNTEIWSLFNQSPIAHPFHIHDVQFYVLDRDGQQPPPGESGRKDVILVEPMETVRFITKFDDFADDQVPYMYHCHMLVHEDDGMMGQFLVVDEQTGTGGDNPASDVLSIFPNPASRGNALHVNTAHDRKIYRIEVYNQDGKHMMSKSMGSPASQIKIDTRYLNSGVFVMQVFTGAGVKFGKFIIR